MPLKTVRGAVYDRTINATLDAAHEAHRPAPSDEELHTLASEAERKAVYGDDSKVDRQGVPISQGIGSPGHENGNHFAAILKYEGQAAYDKAVREIYKRDPARAKALNLPEPTR